jgi:L-alanine-DL-glutamate epimerase-like enolase superfamily enzyme
VKAHPGGFTSHKFGFPHTSLTSDPGRDPSNRMLSTRELINIQQGFENCREAMGWDHDIMVHCHWAYDLRTSIQIADAVESIKPLYLEDPLPVDYTDSWRRLCESTKVPICMGENLADAKGSRISSSTAGPIFCIPICATRAGSSRPSASPIWRTSTAFRWRPITPAAR